MTALMCVCVCGGFQISEILTERFGSVTSCERMKLNIFSSFGTFLITSIRAQRPKWRCEKKKKMHRVVLVMMIMMMMMMIIPVLPSSDHSFRILQASSDLMSSTRRPLVNIGTFPSLADVVDRGYPSDRYRVHELEAAEIWRDRNTGPDTATIEASKANVYPFLPNPQIIPLATLLIKDLCLNSSLL